MPQINSIISAMIPRPKDHENTDNPIKRVNSYFEKIMAKSLNFKFIKTYRPFMYTASNYVIRTIHNTTKMSTKDRHFRRV